MNSRQEMELSPEICFRLKRKLELGLLPLMDVTLQQLYTYEKAREFLFGNPWARDFVDKVKGNLSRFPNEVTLLYVTGESVGTGKFGEVGQWMAEVLLDEKWGEWLCEESGKRPRTHYLSFGMSARVLRQEGQITAPHPYHTPEEVSKIQLHLKQSAALASTNLPAMFPEETHLVIVESPLSLLGDAVVVTPNTFLKFRMTQAQGQKDAVAMRKVFSPYIVNPDVVLTFASFKTKLDIDSLNPNDMSWNIGNEDAAELSRQIINDQALELVGKLVGVRKFTQFDLVKNPNFRNQKVVPALVFHKINKWRIYKGNWLIGREDYIPGEKHLFWRLVHSMELDTKAVRDYGRV